MIPSAVAGCGFAILAAMNGEHRNRGTIVKVAEDARSAKCEGEGAEVFTSDSSSFSYVRSFRPCIRVGGSDFEMGQARTFVRACCFILGTVDPRVTLVLKRLEDEGAGVFGGFGEVGRVQVEHVAGLVFLDLEVAL
jgi:hypothetical protein